MVVFAPGKLVLTGAYAVLEGAPAVVMAVGRGARADASRHGEATPEVRAALGDTPAPHVDASAMFLEGRKMGLGASAAILVASLGARAARDGLDLADGVVRSGLCHEARRAHSVSQGGGSGVDVAASVYGGLLHYTLEEEPSALPVATAAAVTVFACPTSAKTSEFRARVVALAAEQPAAYRSIMNELAYLAKANLAAFATGRVRPDLVSGIAQTMRVLGSLGAHAGVPIVPAGLGDLAEAATAEYGAFCVSGAGGGDVAFYIGMNPPSRGFVERAGRLGLVSVPLNLDTKGVRVESFDSRGAASTQI